MTPPLEIRGVPWTQRRRKALAMLEKYGLSGFEHSFPRELSGGMQQRVLLIRTLIYEPDVVLLDEPLSSLDAQTRALLQDEFLRVWRDTGCTFVLVTHDLDGAIALSERVFLLNSHHGRIVKEFDGDPILENYRVLPLSDRIWHHRAKKGFLYAKEFLSA